MIKTHQAFSKDIRDSQKTTSQKVSSNPYYPLHAFITVPQTDVMFKEVEKFLNKLQNECAAISSLFKHTYLRVRIFDVRMLVQGHGKVQLWEFRIDPV